MAVETRTISEEYALIGADLISKEPLLDYIRQSEVTIVYLSSDKEAKSKGKLVQAQCEAINPKYKWAIPCDFTITVFEPNIVNFTEEQLRILIFHELLHIKIDLANDGTEKYSCNPHDVEDFRVIINRYGIDWNAPEWKEVDIFGS